MKEASTKKEIEMDALKGEMTALREKVTEMEALKALVHQLMAQNRGGAGAGGE